jgi:LCP family protein required for cell wall assembly
MRGVESRPSATPRSGSERLSTRDEQSGWVLESRRDRLRAQYDRGRGLRRFFTLTTLGTLMPGAGLLGTRARRLGVLVVSGVVLVTILALWRTRDRGIVHTAINLAVRPKVLLVLSGVIVVGALIWIGTIVITAMLARPSAKYLSQAERLVTTGFTLLMCLVIAAPAFELVRYLTIQRSVVGTVFQTDSANSVLGSAATDSEDPWADVPRVNVLLLGSDAGKDRTGVRTDSMMVASINTKTGDTVLIGVPRNLENVPIPQDNPLSTIWPNGYNCGDECLMNSIWTQAEEHSDLFPGDPNPGLTSTRDVLSAVLGLPIDHTVIIDLSGFQSLVDAMGGVDINVKERVTIGGHVDEYGNVTGIDGWIEPGQQHLDGFHALWYARSRATTDDFSRMRRQRCVTGALLDQVNPVKMLERYPQLADVAKNHVSVDIPEQDLPAWVDLVERIQQGTIHSLTFTNRVINVVNPDYDKMHQLVQEAIKPKPKPKPSATSGSGTSTPTSKTPSSSPSTTSEPTDTFSSLSATC